MTIGLLGGTFDPPHRGHLALARAALAVEGVERVLLIPAHIPPHKERTDITEPHHRLTMARLLGQEDDRIDVSDIELRRDGPSYTIDTLQMLQEEHPSMGCRLVIGADMAMDFQTWRDAEALVQLAPPIVAERPGTPLPADLVSDGPASMPNSIRSALQAGRTPMRAVDISSTGIRQAFAGGEDPSDKLTPAVAAYIREQGLYR